MTTIETELNTLATGVLESCRIPGRSETCVNSEQVNVRLSAYFDSEDTNRLMSVQICPSSPEVLFSADLAKIMMLFDNVKFCQISNFQDTKNGLKAVPYLRVMGYYLRVLVVLDLYLKKTTLRT